MMNQLIVMKFQNFKKKKKIKKIMMNKMKAKKMFN